MVFILFKARMRKSSNAFTLLQNKIQKNGKCHFTSSGGFIWSITSALSASYGLNATLSDLSSAVARHDRGAAGCAKSESEIQRSILHSSARQYISSCADGRASKLLGSAKVFTLSRHLLSVLCSLTISPRIASLVAEKHLILA
jgi:hypothetical protein